MPTKIFTIGYNLESTENTSHSIVLIKDDDISIRKIELTNS